MPHEEVYARLPELAEIREADGELAELHHHVRACQICSARLSELRRVESLVRSMRGHEMQIVGPRLDQRVRSIPALNPRPTPSRLRHRRVAALAFVAGVAAIAVVAFRPWSAGSTARVAAGPAREVALASRIGPLVARVVIGASGGSEQAVRLMAEGFPVRGPRSYALWLTGPNGSVMLRSFSPNDEGSCIVDTTAPSGAWTAVVLTRGAHPPSPATTVADARL